MVIETEFENDMTYVRANNEKERELIAQKMAREARIDDATKPIKQKRKKFAGGDTASGIRRGTGGGPMHIKDG